MKKLALLLAGVFVIGTFAFAQAQSFSIAFNDSSSGDHINLGFGEDDLLLAFSDEVVDALTPLVYSTGDDPSEATAVVVNSGRVETFWKGTQVFYNRVDLRKANLENVLTDFGAVINDYSDLFSRYGFESSVELATPNSRVLVFSRGEQQARAVFTRSGDGVQVRLTGLN